MPWVNAAAAARVAPIGERPTSSTNGNARLSRSGSVGGNFAGMQAVAAFLTLWCTYLFVQALDRTGFDPARIDLGASVLHGLLAGLIVFGLWPRYGATGRMKPFAAAVAIAVAGFALIDEGLYEPLFEPGTAVEGVTLSGALQSLGQAMVFVLLSLVGAMLAHVARQRTNPAPDLVQITVGHGRRLVERRAIICLQAERDFVRVSTATESFLASMTLAELVQALEPDMLRVHRSHAVMLRHVETWTPTRIVTPAGPVPIGRAYRAAVRARLEAIATR